MWGVALPVDTGAGDPIGDGYTIDFKVVSALPVFKEDHITSYGVDVSDAIDFRETLIGRMRYTLQLQCFMGSQARKGLIQSGSGLRMS